VRTLYKPKWLRAACEDLSSDLKQSLFYHYMIIPSCKLKWQMLFLLFFSSSCLHDHLSPGPRSHKKCKMFLRAMHRSSYSNLIIVYIRWYSDHMRAGKCNWRLHSTRGLLLCQVSPESRWPQMVCVSSLLCPRISSWSTRLLDGIEQHTNWIKQICVFLFCWKFLI